MLLLLTKMIRAKHTRKAIYISGVGIQAPITPRIFWSFKRIVTNVAIAHATIIHDDDQIYTNGPISVFPEIEALVPTTFITR